MIGGGGNNTSIQTTIKQPIIIRIIIMIAILSFYYLALILLQLIPAKTALQTSSAQPGTRSVDGDPSHLVNDNANRTPFFPYSH